MVERWINGRLYDSEEEESCDIEAILQNLILALKEEDQNGKSKNKNDFSDSTNQSGATAANVALAKGAS